jgi:hypothetical protein
LLIQFFPEFGSERCLARIVNAVDGDPNWMLSFNSHYVMR